MSVAHRDLFSHVRYCPDREVQGYGSMSYTPRGYSTGHLPARLREIYHRVNGASYTPTIYSYGTPIAWFDRSEGVWVKPDVSYSITTGRQQSYIQGIVIPPDCGIEEYLRYVSQKMTYSRGEGIKPGRRFTFD